MIAETPSVHMPKVAVLGSGSWATALVKILSESPIEISWWLRKEEKVAFVQQFGHNPDYLSDVSINLNKVKPTSSLLDAFLAANIIVLAMPSAYVAESISPLFNQSWEGKRIYSAIKGLEPNLNLTISKYLKNHLPIGCDQLGVVAGPCHSEEVALERQSYLTVSSSDAKTAGKMAHLLACRYIHTHMLHDVEGVELAAIMKNIFALAVGITRGMNFGDNFQAVMVSNAMKEMRTFIDKASPLPERDYNESAYLGDLLVTAYSPFSRNRIFGQMIGKGYTVKSAQMEMNMVAEGYYAVKSLMAMNETIQVALPICSFVYNILYQYQSPSREMKKLEAALH